MNTRVSRLFLCLLFVLLALRCPALPNLNIRNWQTQDGLPSNKIAAVVQTADGYMWIATSDGLARFDGMRFVLFDASNTDELKDSELSSLWAARDGSLLIGHSSGRVTRFSAGHFETLATRHSTDEGVTKYVFEDEQGEPWTLTDTGVLCRQRDGFILKPEPGLASRLVELACSAEGRVWLSNAGRLYELRGGKLSSLALPCGQSGYLQGLCARREGGLWIVFADQLWSNESGSWKATPAGAFFCATPMHAFIETRDGRLVAGTSDHGAFVTQSKNPAGGLQLWRSTGFPSDWVLSLCEDHEGNLWLGTGNAGLFLLRPSPLSTPAPADHWQDRALLALAPSSQGGLWIGTEGAGLYHWNEYGAENYAKDSGLRAPYVWSVLEDRHGSLWLGTWGGGVYTGQREALHLAPGLGLLPGPVGALCEDSSGGLWVGAAQGLLHYRDGHAEAPPPSEQKGPGNISALVNDGRGGLWMGSRTEGLWAYRQSPQAGFNRIAGLDNNQVQCLLPEDDGTLWIGTAGGGLKRFSQGKIVSIGERQGLVCPTVCCLVTDSSGNLWLGANTGILRVPLSELKACADGRLAQVSCINFGLGDGLPTLKPSGGSQASACRLPDGRLAFATSRGLVLIDPTRLSRNTAVPPVLIESLLLDGREPPAPHAGTLQIPPGEHRIELHYTGLSFASPEKVRFRHRLVGLDETWSEVGPRRSAEYNYLPPGSYCFEVLACNNDGVWSSQPARLPFLILPRFYQTLWFRLLALLILLAASAALSWFATRRRERIKLERLQQQRAIDLERSRIANDMHDDLGSQLTRITMLSEGARSSLQDNPRSTASLDQIYETARRMTRSMDEIVWAVNPKHDRMESLVNYLEKYASDFLGTAGIRCRLDLPIDFPAWTPGSELRHNLFLAFKEVLNNIAKHSGATLAEISVAITETEFRLSIRDDGRGFTPAPDPQAVPAPLASQGNRLSSGNGLPGIHTRMTRLGGRCEIRSMPGNGTLVVLVAPVHAQATAPSLRNL